MVKIKTQEFGDDYLVILMSCQLPCRQVVTLAVWQGDGYGLDATPLFSGTCRFHPNGGVGRQAWLKHGSGPTQHKTDVSGQTSEQCIEDVPCSLCRTQGRLGRAHSDGCLIGRRA